jgi:hypothetical protein
MTRSCLPLQLANVLSTEALFYTCIIPFIVFFGSFAAFMYPLREALHPTGGSCCLDLYVCALGADAYMDSRQACSSLSCLLSAAFCEKLLESAGHRWAGPIAIVRNWTFCLFYVMAELWGSVVVSVLFWGFANQITTVEEAGQFYPLFGLGANVALIFSGQTVKYFSLVRSDTGAACWVEQQQQACCVHAGSRQPASRRGWLGYFPEWPDGHGGAGGPDHHHDLLHHAAQGGAPGQKPA